MITHTIALRYSKALFELDKSPDVLRGRLEALDSIIKVFKSHPKLKDYFSSPHIPEEQKEKIFTETLKSLNDPQLVQYLVALLRKQRFKYLPEIVDAYGHLVDQALGTLEAKLISAVPVAPETRNQLEKKLEKTYGRKVTLTDEIDPSLIGGGILMIANQMIDFSIKGKLAKLKEDLLSTHMRQPNAVKT